MVEIENNTGEYEDDDDYKSTTKTVGERVTRRLLNLTLATLIASQEEEEEEVILQAIMVANDGRTDKTTAFNINDQRVVILTIFQVSSVFPPLVTNTIIEAWNNTPTEFVIKVLVSIRALFCNRGIQNQERGLAKTIVDTDWKKEEKRYEIMIRLFPAILSMKVKGLFPIQHIAVRARNGVTDLKLVSLIPLVLRLGGVEFRKFDEKLRGGLLCQYPPNSEEGSNMKPNVIQQIVMCIGNKDNDDTELLDNVILGVFRSMRESNTVMKQDIQHYNLFNRFYGRNLMSCTLSESILSFFVDWDPLLLTYPCGPDQGNFLPIHWCRDFRTFSLILKLGMKHFCNQFGFVFAERTHRNENGKIFRNTPFLRACRLFGKEKVMNEIMSRYNEFSNNKNVDVNNSTSVCDRFATALLIAAVTDTTESFHVESLYTAIRLDPNVAFVALQQHFRVEGLYLFLQHNPMTIDWILQDLDLRIAPHQNEQQFDAYPTAIDNTSTNNNNNNNNNNSILI